MALNNFKCNYMTPLYFKGLKWKSRGGGKLYIQAVPLCFWSHVHVLPNRLLLLSSFLSFLSIYY